MKNYKTCSTKSMNQDCLLRFDLSTDGYWEKVYAEKDYRNR